MDYVQIYWLYCPIICFVTCTTLTIFVSFLIAHSGSYSSLVKVIDRGSWCSGRLVRVLGLENSRWV